MRAARSAKERDILDKGVVVFLEGIDAANDTLETPAAMRCAVRMARRLKFRRKVRKWKLLKVLIAHGMCPLTQEELDAWEKNGSYPLDNKAFRSWLKATDASPPYCDRATAAVQGRLWRQVVRAKILNQSELLRRLGFDACRRLRAMADEVKNYDAENVEAQAARIYFRALAPDPGFVRAREGTWPNPALNYGYGVLRAAVARALVGSGLTCFRGVHHHNRYNAFCLADDMMEPYRPFVDQYVFGHVPPFDVQATELTREMKARLLQMLTCDVKTGDLKRPLMVALTYTTASLAKYYLGKTDHLVLPSFL